MKNKHCCKTMNEQVNYIHDDDDTAFDCPDNLVFYSPKFDEYGIIIHDGASSSREIEFCPWCGTKLPESKRDLWFDTLEDMGYDNPLDGDIPNRFKTDKWYRK